jgi:hypothetical protein
LCGKYTALKICRRGFILTSAMTSISRFVGRSLESRQVERFGILKVIEDSLERYAEVKNSHACLVRTICEVAHTPVSGDGLLVSFMSSGLSIG